jgi:hypothetical protein
MRVILWVLREMPKWPLAVAACAGVGSALLVIASVNPASTQDVLIKSRGPPTYIVHVPEDRNFFQEALAMRQDSNAARPYRSHKPKWALIRRE